MIRANRMRNPGIGDWGTGIPGANALRILDMLWKAEMMNEI